MKKMLRYKYIILSVAALTLTSSCDDFLDEMPDNRTELNTPEKITKVLVSAYPDASNIKMCEFYSDNYAENAGSYGIMNLVENDFYFWKDTDQEGQDTPQYVWQSCYSAIASTNHALDAIEKLGGGQELNPQRGEALICRAYAHFILATTFCMPYDSKASQYLGIPYVTEMETTVSPDYDRETLDITFDKIKNDIEEALPLISDDAYQVIKYHFNKKAAHAFAARFYLYYMQKDMSNIDKVIEYSDKALGSDPYSTLRDWQALGALTPNGDVQPNAYVNSANGANIMLQKSTSWWPYVGDPAYTTCMKYSHNNALSEETCKSLGPWGVSGTLYQQPFSGNSSTKHGFRRMFQYMKMVTNQSGYGLMITPVFTTDETLICRAEAYALKGEFSKAIEDISAWQKAYTSSTKEVSIDAINQFYGSLDYWTVDKMTVKKRINPDFTVNQGTQENIIHNILHIRRVLNLGAGLRWHDVKRYGITIQRLKFTGDKIEQTDEMQPNDLRRAIQIPQSVISAGLTPNPRN